MASGLQVGVQRGQGLEPLLDFLCHSFNAGTDVDAPMAQALRRLSHEEWRDADVVWRNSKLPPPSPPFRPRARGFFACLTHFAVAASYHGRPV